MACVELADPVTVTGIVMVKIAESTEQVFGEVFASLTLILTNPAVIVE